MIFLPRLAAQIVRGAKTQTRRPLLAHHSDRRYRPGQVLSVQPGRGREAVARIVVTHVDQQLVTEISVADAVAEGFRGVVGFARGWLALYDPPYRDGLDEATDDEVLERWHERFAGQRVWVLRHILDPSASSRLLHRHSERGYTTSPRDALEGEPEAVDPATQERITRQANQRDEERRMQRHDEAVKRMADDLNNATLLIVAAERRARLAGLDVKSEVRLAALSVRRVAEAANSMLGPDQ